MHARAYPLYKWLALSILMILPIHVTRSILLFTAYPKLEHYQPKKAERMIDFFVNEWQGEAIINMVVTQEEDCPDRYSLLNNERWNWPKFSDSK